MKKVKGLLFYSLTALLLLILQNSAFAQAPQLIFPANQDNCVDKQLDFIWASEPTALSYTILVSLTQDFNAVVFNTSNLTDTTVNAILPYNNYIYFWKVIAVYPTTTVSSDVFSFYVKHREPILLFPANNAISQPIDVQLRWTKVVQPDSFKLQIAADENFTVLFEDIFLADTFYNVNPLITAYNQNYYWRVQGNYNTCPSNWSEVRTFKTEFDASVLLTPTALEECVPLSNNFSWTAVVGAVGYRIQVSDTISFTRILLNDTSNTTNKQLTLPSYFKTYYWRVRAEDSTNTGLWAAIGQFKTTISPPLLSSPGNNTPSVVKDEAIGLNWSFGSPDNNPVIYRLQIATSVDFAIGNIILDDATIDTTFYSFTPTTYSTTYYWRVLVNHLTCFSSWSSVWNFKTQFDEPTLIYPTNNMTCTPIEPTFEWTQVGDATKYRLQIATGVNFENTIIINTPDIDTIVKLVPLPNGMTDYYWRVRAEDSSSTGLWSYIKKFTTTIKAPVLTGPENHTGSVLKDSIIMLSWDASVPDTLQPQTYTIQISKDDTTFAPANIVVNQTNIYSLAYNFVPTDYSANYYWRVQTNYDVCTSAWSNYWHFKSEYNKPILLNPFDNEECVSMSPVFHWTIIPNAIAYRIQISDTSSFDNIVEEVGNIRADSAQVELPSGVTLYYWRVRGDDSTSVGLWSDSLKFKTTVEQPVLLYPTNNSNYLPFSNELKWKVNFPADSFLVQVTTKNDFHPDSLLFELLVPNATDEYMSVVINTTLYNTRYWWRVKVLSSPTECGSRWSDTWNFKTMYQQTVLVSPTDQTTCFPIESEYVWNAVPNATKYRLQISDSSDFSNILVNIGEIEDTTYTLRAPLGYTKLYWRVRADDDNNIGMWSNIWSYISAVMNPTAIFPHDGQGNLPLQFMLQWKDEAPDAVYHLQLSKFDDFSELLVDINNINNNYYEVNLPEYHRNYYWRVLAKVNSCSSVWSDVWTFNTSLQPPFLIYPEDESDNLPLSVIFLWELKEQAESYSFNLSTDSNFAATSVVIAISGIPTPQCAIANLYANTVYYWRVNASSSLGTSIWSEVYSFRTAVLGPEVPYLYLPENGSEKLPVDTTLQWLAAPRAVSYDLQVSLNSNFTNKIVDETGLTELSYPLNDLMYDQTYYWRVRAQNDSGKTKWSYVWIFTTIQLAPDEKPVLWTPDNNVTNAPVSLIFSWYAVNRAVGYQIQIATQEDFALNSIIIDDQPIYVTSRIVAGFEYLKKYYWRVRSFNNGGYGPWADPYNFTTIEDPASVDEEFAKSMNVNIAPNPMLETAELTFFMQKNGFVSINLINVIGQVVQNISNKELYQGMQQFSIDGRMLQSGTYFISIEIEYKKIVLPVILNK